MAARWPRITIVERRTIHREPFAYCAHPHLAVCADGAWLLVFNRAPRHPAILHPPQDPEYRNVLMRSEDEGRNWSAPNVVPDYNWGGVECAGVTPLRDGSVLLNQWRFEWLPGALAEASRDAAVTPARLMAGLAQSLEIGQFSQGADPEHWLAWARGPGGVATAHMSRDGGRSFQETYAIATAPYSGGYGMRGGVELAGGDILLPLCDVPHYSQVFVVRSRDGGRTWSKPVLVASGQGHEFEEPAPLLLGSGRIVIALRDNATRRLHMVASDDDGATWSKPRATGIEGYPAHLVALTEGGIVCVVGRRRAPFGVEAHFSDDGENWSPPNTVLDDLPNADLGYPTAAQRRDGDLAIVHYAQDAAGVTGIEMAIVRLA